MTNPRWFIVGAGMLAVAVMLVSLAFTGTRTTSAQAAPCGTPPVGQINAFQQLPTCTPVRIVRTATPTFTVTVEPSSTPVPPTEEPTKTPTATPTGAAGGQAVTPPNTGSGLDSAGYNVYMLLAAALFGAMGAGSIAVAARRSRS